jgi:Flp pilus assembly protein TadG
MVEFMLAFPLILVLALFLIEFGFAFYTYVTVNNAASEAARYAAAGSPAATSCASVAPGTIQARATSESAGVVTCGDITVSYEKVGGTEPVYVRGDGVTVRISHAYTPVTPLGELMSTLSFGALPALTMNACADARLEAAPSPPLSVVAGTTNCGGS